MILDTTFIIDLMDGLPEALKKYYELQEKKEKIIVTSITTFELWSGIGRCTHPESEKRKVKAVLESQFLISLDSECAQKAGLIDGTLRKEGQQIEIQDNLIAGIALHHNEPLLTRNTKHFQRIKGLKIETY